MNLKILKKTTTRMTIKKLNSSGYRGYNISCLWGCTLLFCTPFSLILTLAGLVILSGSLLGFSPESITCKRVKASQINCIIKTSGLLISREQNIDNLRGIRVDTTTETNSDGEKTEGYQIILIAPPEEVVINKIYYSLDDKEIQSTRLHMNNFIKNPQEKFIKIKLQKQSKLDLVGGLFLGLLVLAIGMAPSWVIIKTFFAKKTTQLWIFDKNLGTLILNKKGLHRTKVVKYPLHQILDVQLEEQTRNGEDSSYQVYRVVLKLDSGDRIPLNPFTDNFDKTMVDCIRNFLI